MTPAVLNTPDNEARTSSFRNVLGKYANSEVYDQFLQSDPSGPDLPKGYSQLMSFNTTYDLVMPGRVTDAGIGEYDGHVVHYRISGDRFTIQTKGVNLDFNPFELNRCVIIEKQ